MINCNLERYIFFTLSMVSGDYTVCQKGNKKWSWSLIFIKSVVFLHILTYCSKNLIPEFEVRCMESYLRRVCTFYVLPHVKESFSKFKFSCIIFFKIIFFENCWVVRYHSVTFWKESENNDLRVRIRESERLREREVVVEWK